jgi:hypothetical protein
MSTAAPEPGTHGPVALVAAMVAAFLGRTLSADASALPQADAASGTERRTMTVGHYGAGRAVTRTGWAGWLVRSSRSVLLERDALERGSGPGDDGAGDQHHDGEGHPLERIVRANRICRERGLG